MLLELCTCSGFVCLRCQKKSGSDGKDLDALFLRFLSAPFLSSCLLCFFQKWELPEIMSSMLKVALLSLKSWSFDHTFRVCKSAVIKELQQRFETAASRGPVTVVLPQSTPMQVVGSAQVEAPRSIIDAPVLNSTLAAPVLADAAVLLAATPPAPIQHRRYRSVTSVISQFHCVCVLGVLSLVF